MALFYLIAKKEANLDWADLRQQFVSLKLNYICVFPVSSNLGLSVNGIGITASGKFSDQIREVKAELILVLDVLWRDTYSIVDLYKGESVTHQSYSTALNYI